MRVTGLIGVFVLGIVAFPAVAEEKAKLDPAKIIGTWSYVSGEKDGTKIPAESLKKGIVKIDKEKITLEQPDGKFVIKYKLNAAKTPATLDMEITEGPQGQGAKTTGIISLEKDQLKLCYSAMGGPAPKDFAAKKDSGLHLFVLKPKK